MARTFLKALVSLLAYLLVADIVGVVACTLLDIAPLRHKSGLLPYAIWLVLGFFCGLLSYNTSGAWASPKADGNWTSLPGAAQIGSRVLWVTVATAILLSAGFYKLYWSQNVAGEYFVPDSGPHTTVFLASVVSAVLVGRFALMPSPPSRKTP